MKKWIAMLLCLLMAMGQTAALAYESPIDAAYEAGALLTTQVWVTPGVIPGADAETQTIYTDLLKALKAETTSQRSGGGWVDTFALKISEEDALTFDVAQKDGKIYITSTMLEGQVLTLDAATAEADLLRLLEGLAQEMGIDLKTTLNGVTMEADAGMAAVQELGEKVAGSAGAYLQKLAAKAVVTKGIVTSELHDEADTTVVLTLTPADAAGLFDAVTDGIMASESYLQMLAAQGFTAADGTVFTGEEAVTRYENQMREMSQMLRAQSGEYELTVYTAGGQLVALTMVSRTPEAEKAATAVLEKMKAFTKKDSETPAADESAVMTQGEPDSQNLTYYRKTLAGEVSHLIDWKITQDNETLRVSGEYRDAGDKAQAEVVLSSDGDEISLLYGRDAMGFVAAAAKKSTSETYALVFDREETDADLYWSLKVLGGNHLFEADRFSWNTVCEAENPQETEYLALVCDVQGFGMGNIAQEKLSLDLSLMGESLATLHVDRKATQEEALPTMVDLSKMTDEEMGQWGVETLSQGVSGLVGITQKLPDSVMNALFGF